MTSKRSRRRQAGRPITDAATVRAEVNDGFQNLSARLGRGTGNLQDASTYVVSNPITRMPRNLEAMYRGSWIVGAVIDAVADDMTRAGVDFSSAVKPEVIDALQGAINDLDIMGAVADTIRWARLYGGAIGVLMIDGQALDKPLRPETVAKDQFKGILPIDRWSLNPNVTDVVTDIGPHLGKPKFYDIGPNAPAFQMKRVHYTRVIRMDGVKLPYFQRMAEQGWGQSVVERMFDRLLAFDSTTTGAAQLVFKAYLRTLKVQGLRQILAAGGQAEEALAKQVENIRLYQQTEGLTLLDATDEFGVHNYTFTGLDDILLQFGQQLSGATKIPMVKLYGQSPAGLNSTGESDLRNYYDGISADQGRDLRVPFNTIFDLTYRSVTGEAPPPEFGYTFNPLWQMSEVERSQVTTAHTTAILGAEEQGVIDRPTALKELKQSSQITGVFTNITDEMIEEAEAEPPMLGEGDPGLGDIDAKVSAILSGEGAPSNEAPQP